MHPLAAGKLLKGDDKTLKSLGLRDASLLCLEPLPAPHPGERLSPTAKVILLWRLTAAPSPAPAPAPAPHAAAGIAAPGAAAAVEAEAEAGAGAAPQQSPAIATAVPGRVAVFAPAEELVVDTGSPLQLADLLQCIAAHTGIPAER